MTNERLREIIDNVLAWGCDHEEEFRECLLYAMDLTDEEIKELQLEDYVREEDEEEEEPTQSLTIEYRHKETGLNFVRFNAEDNEEPIQLYCSDDNMGEKDIRVSLETLNKEYDEIARYMEED